MLDDEGSVVVEFILISILVIAIAAGVVQLALTLHVRNMLVSSAAEGAHLASHHDRSVADGAARTEWLVSQSVGDIGHTVDARELVVDGERHIEVTVSAPVPVLGLWGAGSMTVHAHAMEEADRGNG